MGKILRCGEVWGNSCEEVFRADTELGVLAHVLEHWSAVHQTHTTTSTIVGRIRKAIRDDDERPSE
jgi:predicted small metal-binding protein